MYFYPTIGNISVNSTLRIRFSLVFALSHGGPVLPDGLGQLPPREILYYLRTFLLTLVIRVDVCNKA